MPTRRLVLGLTLLVAVAFAIAACGGDDDSGQAAGDGAVTVQLSEQSSSGQSGSAALTASGDGQTTVVLELSNPPDLPQPVHIHDGTCDELGDVAYGLTNLEGGASETTVDVSLEELQGGAFAINAHESEDTIEVYVACGPIG